MNYATIVYFHVIEDYKVTAWVLQICAMFDDLKNVGQKLKLQIVILYYRLITCCMIFTAIKMVILNMFCVT